MTVIVAAVITAFLGSVIRPVSDALVDCARSEGKKNRPNSTTETTLRMGPWLALLPSTADHYFGERGKISTRQRPRPKKNRRSFTGTLDTTPMGFLYQPSRFFAPSLRRTFILEKWSCSDVSSPRVGLNGFY